MVKYLIWRKNFIKIEGHSSSIPAISIIDSKQQTPVPGSLLSAHLKFSRVNNVDADVNIEEQADQQAGTARQQGNN